MTHHNEGRSGGKNGNAGRGSVKNSARLDAFAKRKGKGNADWGTANPELLAAVVVAISGMGGAVTFGLSRDEGAHSLTLLLDGARETLWFNGNADLDDELRDALGVLEAMA